LLFEEHLDLVDQDWCARCVTNKLNKFDIVRAYLSFLEGFQDEVAEPADEWVDDLLELFSIHLSVQIFIVEEELDVYAAFSVTTQLFARFFDNIIHSKSALGDLARVITVLLCEFATNHLHDLVVEIPGT